MKQRKAELISLGDLFGEHDPREADLRRVSAVVSLPRSGPSGRLRTRFASQSPIVQAALETFAVREFPTCIPTAAEPVSSKRFREIELRFDAQAIISGSAVR